MLRLKAYRSKLYDKVKEIALDYKSAADGTLSAAKERPYRALFYAGCTVLGLAAYKSLPTEASYSASLVESSHDLLLCGPGKSKATDNYLQNKLQYLAKGMLRYQQLGLFSIMYYSEYDKDTKSFVSQCKYSNPRWNEFPRRVIDIGFFGKWWKLHYMMIDYDIDFDEIPKDFKNFSDRIIDFVKTLFGYSYYNNLIYHPITQSLYVPTTVNDNLEA